MNSAPTAISASPPHLTRLEDDRPPSFSCYALQEDYAARGNPAPLTRHIHRAPGKLVSEVCAQYADKTGESSPYKWGGARSVPQSRAQRLAAPYRFARTN